MRQRPWHILISNPWAIAMLGAVLSFTSVRAVSEGSGAFDVDEVAWKVGLPVPIEGSGRESRFNIPSSGIKSQTLVIVSSLARSSQDFPIRVTSRPISRAEIQPISRAHDPSPKAVSVARRGLPAVPDIVTTTPPPRRSFHLMARAGDVASASNYLAIQSKLKGLGKRVQVYLDESDEGQVDRETVDDIIATFDGKVFPVAASNFGQARDVDADGRFTVLISSWLSRLGGGRNPVDGFVRGADLDPTLPSPFSNHCDMMYLSASLKSGPHLRTVVAHEYTHAVTFSAKAYHADDGKYCGREEEGWIDEALAHLVEDLHGFSRTNIDYRVSGFLSRPEAYRLVVDDYYAADLFRSHGNRGGTYLFLRWCADRFGPRLIPAMIQSDKKGIENLEAATGRSFESLYRDWTVSLFMNGLSTKRGLVDRGAAGPRTHRVKADGQTVSWSSAGTASRFLLIEGSVSGGVEVTVEAPASARIQMTAVRLPDDLAGLDLDVKATSTSDGHPALRATLRERNGTAVRITGLSWEPAVPAADPHAQGFHRATLDETAIASNLGSSRLPAHGFMESGPIASAGALPRVTPLVMKVVGTDIQGRRVAAWADFVPNIADDTDIEAEAEARGDGG